MTEVSVEGLLWDMSLLPLAAKHTKLFITRPRRKAIDIAVQSFSKAYGGDANIKASLYAINALWKWSNSDYRKSMEQELAFKIKNFSKGPKLTYERHLHNTNYTENSINLFIDLILCNHVFVHNETTLGLSMVEPLTDFFGQFGIFGQVPLNNEDPDRDEIEQQNQSYQVVRQRIRRLKKNRDISLIEEASKTLATQVYATF